MPVEPAEPRGEPYQPSTERWTPGAGLERLRREHPELIPEITDEDRRIADEIITAGEAADRMPAEREQR